MPKDSFTFDPRAFRLFYDRSEIRSIREADKIDRSQKVNGNIMTILLQTIVSKK